MAFSMIRLLTVERSHIRFQSRVRDVLISFPHRIDHPRLQIWHSERNAVEEMGADSVWRCPVGVQIVRKLERERPITDHIDYFGHVAIVTIGHARNSLLNPE